MTTIETKLGAVEGVSDRGVQIFLGLPYAAPPVDDLRWRAPQPAPAWQGIRDATRHGDRCFQPPYPPVLNFGDIPGAFSEDCLYLNIYTPGADGKKRPVMFWIHGGGNIQGSANEYDGATLARENDVIVVAINYRMGIFGFFDLSRFGEDFTGSANIGFQDQIAALAWVRDNIADYGGDAGNVTIMGESAGGGAVLALIGCPSADKLFGKAIAFSPADTPESPVDNVAMLSATQQTAPEELLSNLRTKTGAELFNIQLTGGFSVSPHIDGVVVTRSAANALRERGADGPALISGCCKDEGTYLGPLMAAIPGAMDIMMPMFAKAIGAGDADRYLRFLDKQVGDDDSNKKIVRFWYDLFRAAAMRSVLAATEGGAGGWLFNFEVPTANPLGVTHASEIAFTFNAFKNDTPMVTFHDKKDPAIQDFANKWSQTFTNFARTGDPNGAGLPQWPQYDATTRACLIADLPPRIEEDPDGEARAAYGLA
jgi:para-nitrobenzyl esterase